MEDFKLKLIKYPKNAIIYVEGSEKVDSFYIIKEGKAKISRYIDITDDPNEYYLKTGDYFGVVSCISRRPRLETITSISDLIVIGVKREQFVELIKRNKSVALKILKLYSKKLRTYDNAITRLSLKKPIPSDPESIFTIGEYYYKINKYREARYAFKKFIELRNTSINVPAAKNYLEKINQLLEDKEDFKQITPLIREYKPDSVLFCENEPGNEVFVIQEGKIKITKIVSGKEVLLAVLNPGDIVGEMALIDNQPRSATAIAYGTVKVLAINRENFNVMVSNQPQITFKIVQLLSERIWIAYRQLENLALTEPYERLLDILLIQLEKKRIKFDNNVSYVFEIGPDELLTMAGFSPEENREYIEQILQNPNFKLVEGKLAVENTLELKKLVDVYRKKSKKDIYS